MTLTNIILCIISVLFLQNKVRNKFWMLASKEKFKQKDYFYFYAVKQQVIDIQRYYNQLIYKLVTKCF